MLALHQPCTFDLANDVPQVVGPLLGISPTTAQVCAVAPGAREGSECGLYDSGLLGCAREGIQDAQLRVAFK